MTELIFDIETVPDVATGRKLYNLEGLTDADVAKAMFTLRREKTGHDFLAHYLHKIVAISLVMDKAGELKVWSLGKETADEKELIQRFFLGIDKLEPTLVSWNGSGFDLPVLHYRAMLHGISAPTYWEKGDNDNNYKFNNYLSRFHYRHLDIMDVIAGYQARAVAPLDDIASMLGFPGKMGMSGAKVWDQYIDGDLKSIRDYCETDVLNTYGVYLRFERMRGTLAPEEYEIKIQALKCYLESEAHRPHLLEFAKKMEDRSMICG